MTANAKHAVFWSGGLDSTVLLWDLLKHPHRWGLSPEDVIIPVYLDHTGAQQIPDLAGLLPVGGPRSFDFCSVRLGIPGEPSLTPKAPKGLVGYVDDFTSGWSEFYDGRSDHIAFFQPTLTFAWLNRFVTEHPPHGTRELHLWWGFQNEPQIWEKYDEADVWFGEVTGEWAESLEAMTNLTGPPYPVTVHTPFLDQRLSKQHIKQLGMDLGVPLDKTSSCTQMRPPTKCGKCNGCNEWNQVMGYVDDQREKGSEAHVSG